MAIENVFLSIVIPAYNEETRILPSLERIMAFLAQQNYAAEVLVVDDGSQDNTYACVKEFAQAHPRVGVLRNPHRGKGYTVRTGMLAARGEWRFMCDADLSMPIEEVAKFLPPQLEGTEVAIGSREVAGAHRYEEPPYRHLMGRVFNLVVQLVAVRGFQDTQCGFKCFRAAVAEDIFSLQRTEGWGFDVEILYLARKHRYRITEVPIHWYYGERSKVDPVRDTIRMFREALSVRCNDWRGLYKREARLAEKANK